MLIGVVRRDFQLPVVDCSKNTPPPAVLLANGGKSTTELNWCGTQPLVLSVEKNPAWAYQWQKDGINLRGSTTDTLQVAESGVYTVVKSQANVCANDTVSQAVNVNVSKTAAVNLSVTTPAPYCTGDTVTIQADGQPGTQYQWRRDGRAIAGEQATLRVYQSGTYRVLTKSSVAECDGLDSVQLTINELPVAQISASAAKFCPDSSVQLTTVSGTDYSYIWQRDGIKLTDIESKVLANQAGTYQVTVAAPTGCTAVSNAYALGQFERPAVQFDSIAPVCVTNLALLPLQGQPEGGIYTGVGVKDNRFDPTVAGVGRHELTYTITSADGCR
ncbi:MAG: gliding motility-associated C-terminal domain-containing protein, partial [Cytophagaceae bacterium]